MMQHFLFDLDACLLLCFSFRFLRSLRAKLMGRWVMKILCTSFSPRKTSLLSLVLSIGTHLSPSCWYWFGYMKFSPGLNRKLLYCIYYNWAKTIDIFLRCRFKCTDLDENGVITPNEMQFFFEEQLHRMECITQEPVLFNDILCQIIDMIGPEVRGFSNHNMVVWFFLADYDVFIWLESSIWLVTLQKENCITLQDLKGSKLSGNVFNILFNLNKFMAFETRDPFLMRQVHLGLLWIFCMNA